jgi:hypothetical protein
MLPDLTISPDCCGYGGGVGVVPWQARGAERWEKEKGWKGGKEKEGFRTASGQISAGIGAAARVFCGTWGTNWALGLQLLWRLINNCENLGWPYYCISFFICIPLYILFSVFSLVFFCSIDL